MRTEPFFVFALLSVACASAPSPAPVTPAAAASAPVDGERARVATFAKDESEALDALAATDARFARRLGAIDEDKQRSSAVKALVAGDEDAAVEGGSLDLFSFAARGRAVDEAAKIVASSPEPTKDEGDGAPIARPRLERELLDRVVVEERARLDEERELPRGASALVRGIVATWQPARSSNAAASRDAWLSRRLDEVRASLREEPITRALLLELDDALDPLERLTASSDFPQTAQAMAHLRVAIDAAAPAPSDDVSWPRVAAALTAHLGVSLTPTELRARLERAEHAFRAEATARLARAGVNERDVAKRASELVLADGACGSDASSRVRLIAPPAERASICAALRAIHDADDDAARAAVAVALHDEAVIALWAMGIHEAKLGPNRAMALAHPYFGAEPELEAKWVRFAAARPVAAIGAGLAAELLARDPSIASRWFAFGDAPLDVVERELFSASTPPPPASPRP